MGRDPQRTPTKLWTKPGPAQGWVGRSITLGLCTKLTFVLYLISPLQHPASDLLSDHSQDSNWRGEKEMLLKGKTLV